ncbi:Cof-type HAD-IIB family hydrolase [Peribacillus loiseleuriae]|uniref:Cof-type HAD-IIB family hydrolase n=1 Tax=Peribacillus loiseleuriae TaxID=1679170 RepID=UPI003825FE6C
MIKTIATDMDGTLLNRVQKVSKENKDAIEAAQRQGIEVIVATGRSYEEARIALDEAKLNLPIIAANGAAVYTKDGQIVTSNPMSSEKGLETIELLEKENLIFEVYTSNGVYSKNYEASVAVLVDIILTANPDADPLKVSARAHDRLRMGLVNTINDYREIFTMPGVEIHKMLVFSSDLTALGQVAGEIKGIKGLAVSSSGRENLEISSESAQKGIALKNYLDEKGESIKEAMAIGDNFNDVSMFERAGRSVAMGNAPLEIQRLCQFVTAKNDEHGVAKAIQEVLKEVQAANNA